MPEIDPDALRQTGRPSVRWSDIVHALATIAGAATHAHLETALHCACQDIVGAKEAFLLFPAEAGLPATKAHGEGMTGAAPSVSPIGYAGTHPFLAPRNASPSPMRNSMKSMASFPIGAQPSPAMLRIYWNDAGHPSDAETTLLELFAGAGTATLPRLTGPCAPAAGTQLSAAEAEPIAGPATADSLHAHKLEALGRHAATLVHDLGNLLSPVMAGLELIARSTGHDRQVSDHLDMAMSAAASAQTLLRNLLDFTRKEAAQSTALAPSRFLADMQPILSMTAGPTISLRIEAAPDLPNLIAERQLLEVALLHLVANARDAMPAGGEVIVGAQPIDETTARNAVPNPWIRLFVRDRGSGMDETTRRRAGERFFTTKKRGMGTGLGLAMVRDMAENGGGKLDIVSDRKTGTEIGLWLPLAPQTPAVPDEQHASNDAKLAFVIDDHGLVRKGMAALLREDGYRVVEMDNAPACLAEIEAGTIPDLIVADHLMPGMTGLSLASRLDAQHPGIPFLLVSAIDDIAQLPGNVVRIGKPFRPHHLQAGIRDARRHSTPDANCAPSPRRATG
ncbi:ATP-binding protein [Sphingobium yanoikuyae]|uniref:ATP-binding protein n=1 Tax=Sphingobium yanoikuyae TaxID=13690 RepID=UPI0028ACEE16|nr:ATP-binding protein [Sphingobium yanoikuyae]